MKIYLASSWRNERQPEIHNLLTEWGHDVYDFRNPAPFNSGFRWTDIHENWKSWTPEQFRAALDNDIAEQGFKLDFDAMKNADVCVLLMPCGRSAHLEAGYFVGAGKPLIILLSSGEPELMYKMADVICLAADDGLSEALDEISDRVIRNTIAAI